MRASGNSFMKFELSANFPSRVTSYFASEPCVV